MSSAIDIDDLCQQICPTAPPNGEFGCAVVPLDKQQLLDLPSQRVAHVAYFDPRQGATIL